MTLDEIKALDREYLIPREVADVLGCDQYGINVAAREHPELLGFNVAVIGSRVKIPRRAFVKWMEGGCDHGNPR